MHSGVLDGVFVTIPGPQGSKPEFRALPAPTRDDLSEISGRVYQRTRELLIRLGRDWEQPEQMDDDGEEQETLLLECATASIRGVGLLGEEAGQRLIPATERLGVPADLKNSYLSGGFDLHASRRVAAGDRAGLERMCRYILRHISHPPHVSARPSAIH